MAGINVLGKLNTKASDGVLADSTQISGSYMSVADSSVRDALSAEVAPNGTKVYVRDEDKIYLKKNNTWVEDVVESGLIIGTLKSVHQTGGPLGEIETSGGASYNYLVSNVSASFNTEGTASFRPVMLKLSDENSATETVILNFKVDSRKSPNEDSDYYIYASDNGTDADQAPSILTFVESSLALKVPTTYRTGTYTLRQSELLLSFGTPSNPGYPNNKQVNLVDSKFTFVYNEDSNVSTTLILNCQNSEVHIFDNSNHTNSGVYYEFRNCIDTKVYLHGKAKVAFTNQTQDNGATTTYSHAGCEIILCKDYFADYTPAGIFVASNADSTLRIIDERLIGPYTKSIIASGETASISNSGNWSGNATNGYSATIAYAQHRKGYNGDKYFPKVKTYSKTTTSNVFEEVYDSATINILTGEVTVYSDVDTPEYLVVIE